MHPAEDPNSPEEGDIQTPKLVQPRDHKAKVSVWADLTVDDIDRLNESLNVDHNKQVLADIFHLDAWKEDPREAIVMDLYYYTIQFARDNNFNREKTSTFFSIMKKTHEVAIETPFGNLEQTFRYFKELILCHAVSRPPHGLELFNVDEVRKISEYAVNTYFRHFKMYKYAFTPLIRLDLTIHYQGVCVPTPEPPRVVDSDEDGLSLLVTRLEDTETEGSQAVEGEAVSSDGEGEGEPQGDGEHQRQGDDEHQSDGERQGDERQGDCGENGQPQLEEEEGEMAEEEESEARQELRSMIQTYLAEEIKKVKIGVDEQLKVTEDTLSKKIDLAENPSGKKPKGSAKKK